MKSNRSDIIKYVFILFVVILAIVTYVVYQKTKSSSTSSNTSESTENTNMIKEIRLGIAEYDTMNPLLSDNKNVQQISKLIYDSLITFDENYNFNYSLAKEISKTDNIEYVIKLRDDVYWQSGENFTANDVKFTIETLASIDSIYTENIKNIGTIEIVDDYTITLVLNSSTPFFEYNLTFPIMSEKYFEGEDFSSSSKTAGATGTGMYTIESISDNLIKLTKNANYWDKDNKDAIIETITVNLYSNMGEVYTAFKNGNIDLVDTTLSSVSEYIGTLGYTASAYSTREFDYLVFNCSSGCLSDKYARQALYYAIDITAIVNSCYGSDYQASTFPLDYGSWVYSSGGVDNVYDADKAKEILQNNGWTYSNGSWKKDISGTSTKLEFTITVNTSNSLDINVANKIKTQLSDIGIGVTVKEVSSKNYYSYINKKSNYEAIIININTAFSPSVATYMGSGNTSNYSNDELNDILSQIYATGDSNTINELYSSIYTIYTEDVPFVGIARKQGVVVYNSNLVGTTKPTAFNIFNGFQKWYRKNY